MAPNLKILQINLAHSRAAADNLSRVVFELQPDIILIQEPYYTPHNHIVGCTMNDIIFSADKNPLCAIVVRNRRLMPFPIKINRKQIIVNLDYKEEKITLISIYCPPSSNFTELLFELNNDLRKLQYSNLVIGGDFNAKSSIWGKQSTDQRGEELIEFTLNNNLITLNRPDSLPTFETINGKSWIDLTLTSSNLLTELIYWKVLETETLADHRYIFFSLFYEKRPPLKLLTKKGEIRIMNSIKQERWFQQTGNTTITSIFQLKIILNIFYQKIAKYRNKFMSKIDKNQKAHPWWNEDINIKRKQLRALRRRYQRCKNPVLRNTFKNAYYEFLKEYKTMISNAKEKSFQKFCTNNTKQNTFGLPYKLAFEKIKPPVIIPPILKENGSFTTNLEESITEIMTCLFQKDDSQNDSNEQANIRLYIIEEPNEPDDLKFNKNEVEDILQKLKPKSAPGLDNITTTLIKSIYTLHPNFVLNIFNSALKYGYFPTEWKNAKLILLNKPDKPSNNPRSYRPICLNSIFGKILERLLNSRLYHFLYKNKLFHPNQFGFTHNKSAINALYQLKNILIENKNANTHSVLISLDYQGAFDSLWYPFVLSYLKEHKCPSNLYKLLKSFFHNRSLTYASSVVERSQTLEIGCPQGSPISPLLWNILISGLLNLKLPYPTHIQAYADDTILVITGKTRREIETIANITLEIISQWSTEHRLNLNYSKCYCMLIAAGKRLSQGRPPTVRINNHNLKYVTTLRLLGVVFDVNLSFIPHIEYLREKILKHTLKMTTFAKIHWGINQKQQKELYLRCIERYIVYGASIWWRETHNTHLLRKVISLQRIPLLNIARAYNTSSNLSLPILCNIPPIHITLKKEVKQFLIFQENKEIECNNQLYNKQNTEYMYDRWILHPSKKFKIEFQQNTTVSCNLHIYTDGSFSPNKVGAAFVAILPTGTIEKVSQFKLPNYATIYDAERIAFEEALKYILINKSNSERIAIHTDSLSLLQNLANIQTKTETIHRLKQLIIQIQNKNTIHFSYVKAHAGDEGNDLADHYAKLAHFNGRIVSCLYSQKTVKKELNKEVRREWDDEWKRLGREKELFTWIPTVYNIPEMFPSSHLLTQIITGHGRFPFYLFRFKITNTNNCFCGLPTANFEHYLTTCPWTLTFRNELNKLKYTVFDNATKWSILSNVKAIKVMERMMMFIQEEVVT